MEFFKIELNDNRKHDEELLTIFREELIPNLNIEKLLLLAGSDKSRYTIFCCKIGSKIVSVNIFFILNFIYKKKDYFGYQSGFSATLREFKGKNIWSKLIEFSESEIRKTDNSFIFGYPNENSFPLIV